MRILILGLVLLVAGARLNAAKYYVDYSRGSDANSGVSQTAPWRHCPGDPAATGIAAAVNLFAGDTVYFKGGVTYVFTGSTGIALEWDGASGSPITYDGNSAGTWGSGRAKFTDNYSTRSISAFSSTAPRRYLSFKSLEIGPIGGSASLPLNLLLAVAPKFGGGISLSGGADNILVEGCAFSRLGYFYNRKPMSAASLNGVGVAVGNVCRSVKIIGCEFTNLAKGFDVCETTELSATLIQSSVFRGGIVWPVMLPAAAGSPSTTAFNTDKTSFQEDPAFSGSWAGYGPSPRTETATVAVGSPVKLSATAVAEPVASFQWYKNGTALVGATNATLAFASVQASDAGTYTAIAKNTLGWTTSNSLVLTVGGSSSSRIAPAITSQPVAQSVASGTTVTFSVTATGSPAPTYQWQKNGVNISGATASKLTLSSVATTAASNYRVVVTNTAGSVTSSQVTLTVTAPRNSSTAPVITQQPVSKTVTAGGSATFSVTATASPAPTYQWQKNGVNIASATAATLTVSNASSASAGTYRVVVKNSLGTVTSSGATLTVTAASSAPAITRQPLSQTVSSGANVTFTVVATGSPAPTYQWQKNGANITGATRASLVVSNVGSANVGSYRVVVKNSAGTVTSTTANLALQSTATSNSSDSSTTVAGPLCFVLRTVTSSAPIVRVDFVVPGTTSKVILVRAAGPTFVAVGAVGALPDPVIRLMKGGTMLYQNDNWGGASLLTTGFAQVGAMPFVSSTSKDAALRVTLAPGTYTIEVSGYRGSIGSALVEAYDLNASSMTQ